MNCQRHQSLICPSWWGNARGCYECAKDRYADYRPQEPHGYIEMTPHGEILGPSDREHQHEKNYIDRSSDK